MMIEVKTLSLFLILATTLFAGLAIVPTSFDLAEGSLLPLSHNEGQGNDDSKDSPSDDDSGGGNDPPKKRGNN